MVVDQGWSNSRNTIAVKCVNQRRKQVHQLEQTFSVKWLASVVEGIYDGASAGYRLPTPDHQYSPCSSVSSAWL